AGTYAVFGRQVAPWRVMSALMVAGAWWIAVAWARRTRGPTAGWIVLGVALLEPFTPRYAGRFLTEPVVMLLATALLASVACAARSPKRWPMIAAGVLMGLCVVTRSVTGAWLPAVALAVYLGRRLGPANAARPRAAIAGVACVALACATAAPWWARNVVVLNEPMPLGTQGGLAIAGGYCDGALDNTGKWVSPHELPAIVDVDRRAADAAEAGEPWTPLQREIAKSKAGQAHVAQWARANLDQMPKLVAMRLYSHWTDRSGLMGLILVIVGASTIAWRWRRGLVGVWLVIGMNTLAVAVTYAVGSGRFLVPLLPAMAVLAGCAVQAHVRKRRGNVRRRARLAARA
ncbi:MAG: hypothetical protein AAF612_10555, partial [Planctomycetota bacterium]